MKRKLGLVTCLFLLLVVPACLRKPTTVTNTDWVVCQVNMRPAATTGTETLNGKILEYSSCFEYYESQSDNSMPAAVFLKPTDFSPNVCRVYDETTHEIRITAAGRKPVFRVYRDKIEVGLIRIQYF